MEDEVLDVEFWSNIKTESPRTHRAFLAWVDEYKKAVNWNKLFNDQSLGHFGDAPKFHDLPGFMQLGIVLKFALENAISCKALFQPGVEIARIFTLLENLLIPAQGLKQPRIS